MEDGFSFATTSGSVGLNGQTIRFNNSASSSEGRLNYDKCKSAVRSLRLRTTMLVVFNYRYMVSHFTVVRDYKHSQSEVRDFGQGVLIIFFISPASSSVLRLNYDE